MPPHLAGGLTIGDMAVLRIVADEYRRRARCQLSLDEIGARAGVCRNTVKRAMKKARDQNLIRIEERPMPGQRHLSNFVTIISLEWLKWLRRPSTDHQGGGGHSGAPTDKTLKDDDDCENHRISKASAHAAMPCEGQPSKEAVEFAAELANIAGYRKAAVSESWRDADPPQVVQVWLDELTEHALEINRQPVDILRALANAVMRRKRLSDASPPYSPRYFSAEVKKLVAQLNEGRRAVLESRSQAAHPTREPARRVE